MTSSIKLNTAAKRFLLVAPIVILLTAAFFAIRWSLALSIAEQAPDKVVAEFAARQASGFPQTHFSLATLSEKTFLAEDLALALREYETATALSPHDFRLWLALGRARERAGDAEGAEQAVRRAAELAPAYAQVRWTLGNILLRRGKPDQAFAEMRFAAEQNPEFAAPAVDAVIRFLETTDANEVLGKTGDSPQIRAALVDALSREENFDAALRIWNQFSPEEKIRYKTEGDVLYNHLLQAKRFRAALAFSSQNPVGEGSGDEKIAVEKISNGDFESDRISTGSAPLPFAWTIGDGGEPQIGFDSAVRRGGARSLAFLFKSVSGQEFRPVYQVVAVEPNARYRLEFYARTAGLKSTATMRWDIEDAVDNRILASSSPVPAADTDWQKITVDFAAPPKTEAVSIKLARVPCTQQPCSLIGRIWFDDFNLERIDTEGKN